MQKGVGPGPVGAHQQLPVPVPDRHVRRPVRLPGRVGERRVVAAVLPEQRPGPGRGLAQQRRAEVLAVRLVPRREPRAAQPAQGREQVHARDDRGVVGHPRRDEPRTPGDQRHPEAALVEAQLAAAQAARPLPAERRERAVVRQEQHHRRPARLPGPHPVEQPADLTVHLGKYLGQPLRGVALAHRSAALAGLLVLGRRHPRRVRVVQPQVHEARSVRVRLQEVERPVDHPPGPLPPLHLVVGRPDPVAGGDVRVRLGALVGAQAEVVPVGGELRRVGHVPAAAEVPLADVGGPVPGGLERPRQRRGLGVEEVGLPARPVAGPGLEEAGEPPPAGELAGDEPAPRRRADRGGRVVPGEPHALLGHQVEVRGGGWAAGARQVARPEVVGEHQYDVRRRAGRGGR